jgi:hypothetical protein
MPTTSFPAIRSTRRKTSITFPANHFLAVIFRSKCLERGFNNSTTETTPSVSQNTHMKGEEGGIPEDKVESRFLLDVIIRERAT